MSDDHDQEHCMKLAEPLLSDLHAVWHHAFEMYQRMPAEFTAEHDDTTVANCIRSHAWTEVLRRFDGRSGFVLMRLRGLNLLLHKDETVWRFKLVDGAGRHSNYQTQQQRDFDDQLELPGIPPAAVRLTSGYQPDEAAQAIERIVVARPLGPSIRWVAQVNVIDGTSTWTDITPVRLPGTSRVDYRGRGKRPR
jgi:tryptophan 2,3-dioxygenase